VKPEQPLPRPSLTLRHFQAAMKSANESRSSPYASARIKGAPGLRQADMLRKSPSFPVVGKEVHNQDKRCGVVSRPEGGNLSTKPTCDAPSERPCSAISPLRRNHVERWVDPVKRPGSRVCRDGRSRHPQPEPQPNSRVRPSSE